MTDEKQPEEVVDDVTPEPPKPVASKKHTAKHAPTPDAGQVLAPCTSGPTAAEVAEGRARRAKGAK